MEMLPGEFFEGIAVGSQHLYAVVHPVDALAIFPDLPLLISDGDLGSYPVNQIIAGSECQQQQSHDRHNGRKNEETAVFSREQVFDFSHKVLSIVCKNS